jgi:hypothetical protein
MKYVVIEVIMRSGVEMEIPIIFPDLLVHSEVADMLQLKLSQQFKDADIKPISAGFLSSLSIDSGCCHGESESLGLKSRGMKDSALVTGCDYGSMYA